MFGDLASGGVFCVVLFVGFGYLACGLVLLMWLPRYDSNFG